MFNTLIRLGVSARRFARNGDGSFPAIFMLLLRLYTKSKLFGKRGTPVIEVIGDFTFQAFSYPSLINMYQEIFLEQVYKADIKSRSPFIVDCGANIGISVLYFKHKFPDSEIWAFEPNPRSFEMLKRNIESNKIRNVRLFNCALGQHNGNITFYQPTDDASVNGSIVEGYSESHAIQVEVVKLSELIEGRKVDLLKIDVEGSEQQVITDLQDGNALNNVELIVLEYHQKVCQPLDRFLPQFDRFGFKSVIKGTDTGQDVLIHFSRT
jgi:FkbM family methyltransferase